MFSSISFAFNFPVSVSYLFHANLLSLICCMFICMTLAVTVVCNIRMLPSSLIMLLKITNIQPTVCLCVCLNLVKMCTAWMWMVWHAWVSLLCLFKLHLMLQKLSVLNDCKHTHTHTHTRMYRIMPRENEFGYE